MFSKRICLAVSMAVIMSGCATSQSNVNNGQIATTSPTSLKEYISQQRAQDVGFSYNYYNVIAENSKQTIIEYRTINEVVKGATARDVMEVLDDLKGYCTLIGGTGVYGQQSIDILKYRPTSLSLDYVSYLNAMKAQKGYNSGFYQCSSPKDGFKVTLKDYLEVQQSDTLGNKRDIKETYSRYYFVEHDKPQTLGQKTWLSNPKYATFANKTPRVEQFFGDTTFPWKYERIMKSQQYCTFHGGEFLIKSPMLQFKEVSMDEYLFERMAQFKDTTAINVFMKAETFTCKGTKGGEHDFTLMHSGQNLELKW